MPDLHINSFGYFCLHSRKGPLKPTFESSIHAQTYIYEGLCFSKRYDGGQEGTEFEAKHGLGGWHLEHTQTAIKAAIQDLNLPAAETKGILIRTKSLFWLYPSMMTDTFQTSTFFQTFSASFKPHFAVSITLSFGKMVRLSTLSVTLILVLIFTAQALDARKLLSMEKNEAYSLGASFPRGSVPPSSPSNGGNAEIVAEKLFAHQTGRVIHMDGRSLESTPSPGVGH
ncbi:hypothetical protein Pfo_014285 [Paulownia fortunei]|nr:hypothetical protein Pfo_014285 [Paulownia fortunei]